ncbi:odorant receptor 131-2-like [Lampris incognitus]|uniref:odorant receptor 131-2-like n=1 Tax=Lampris incognitus TaxID=2546036 RepID=UPI0024B53BB0|nr:odorant receptor 131-2-like [Lampris incognitus]
MDSYNDAFIKNFITFTLSVIIMSINASFVYTYFKSRVFQRDPRYVLYTHLVINDMILLTIAVVLQITLYVASLSLIPCCLLLLMAITTNKNSSLNLAGMAIERYVAICRPLHHAKICTRQRTYILIGLIWGVSLTLALTDIFIFFATQPLSIFSRTILCYASAVYSTPHHRAKSMVVQVLVFAVVFLILIITYMKVFFAARTASGTNQDSGRKACNTILLHGAQLLIYMLSFLSPFINIILVTALPNSRTNIVFSTYLFTNVLPRLLSPLIYGIRDQKLRSHLKLYFLKGCFRPMAKKAKPRS